MNDEQIYATLTSIFHDVFDDDSIEVTSGLSANDVAGWDSLTHIRLLITVEKAFHVTFSTSEVDHLKCVGDLVALIRSRV